FRPGRGAHQALEQITAALKAGKTEVYDADLEGYFDSIPHDCTSPDKTDTEIWLTNAVCYRSECCTAFKVASRHKRHLPTGYPPFIPFALLNYVTHSEKE